MPRYKEKFKKEMAFFIHPRTGYVTYNPKCVMCTEGCKQSYRVKIVRCPDYNKKVTEENICHTKKK